MSLAAVILNYNDAGTTIDAAARVGGFSCVDHVVIVDNASPDESAGRIAAALGLLPVKDGERAGLTGAKDTAEARTAGKKTDQVPAKVWTSGGDLRPRTVLLLAPKNGGYGYGNNLGVRYAAEVLQASEVLIANPDADMPEETVGRMQRVLREDAKTAAVGAVMRESDDAEIRYREYLAAGWRDRTLLQEVLHSGPVCKRIFGGWLNYPESYYRGREEIPVYAVHGSMLMVSGSHFTAVGGYDPAMFLYMEEYALGWRLRKAGLRTVLLSAGYRHAGSHSITGAGLGAVQREQLRQASERIYYRDYLGAGSVSMALIRIFQGIVMAETRLAALFGRL